MLTPPQLTSGKGFGFEDQVGAWFVVQMLSGIAPLGGSLGKLEQLSFQTRADGWLIDDLLLTCSDGGVIHRCPFSIKSNRQFTSRKAPGDFVALAWEQFCSPLPNPFNSDNDYIGIITASLPLEVVDALTHLRNAARQQTSDVMAGRVASGEFSKVATALYLSFACPPEFAERMPANPLQIPELLRRLFVLPLDLQEVESRDLSQALAWCQQALDSGKPNEARILWDALLRITAETRWEGGQIDLANLLAKLRGHFRLRPHPDFAPDWQRVLRNSKQRIEALPATIGPSAHLTRQALLTEIAEHVEAHPVTVLLGESGVGKSVLARDYARSIGSDTETIWLDAKSLDVDSLPEFSTGLGTHFGWETLTRAANWARLILVLDGIEKLWRDEALATLVRLLGVLHLGHPDSPFRVLLTCQPRDWERILMRLIDTGLDVSALSPVEIDGLEQQELEKLLTTYPQLKTLLARSNLLPLLARPKVLDVLVRHIVVGSLPNTRRWVGETDLIQWYWQAEVTLQADGLSRGALLLKLADATAASSHRTIGCIPPPAPLTRPMGPGYSRRSLPEKGTGAGFPGRCGNE
jgi:ABC-type cobalamin/Fe3+-siderophores transport system ATPase subunit